MSIVVVRSVYQEERAVNMCKDVQDTRSRMLGCAVGLRMWRCGGGGVRYGAQSVMVCGRVCPEAGNKVWHRGRHPSRAKASEGP